MPNCAVVDLTTGRVTNVIVATASDSAPDGSVLISVTDDQPVSIGWTFAIGQGFVPPPAPAQEG